MEKIEEKEVNQRNGRLRALLEFSGLIGNVVEKLGLYVILEVLVQILASLLTS